MHLIENNWTAPVQLPTYLLYILQASCRSSIPFKFQPKIPQQNTNWLPPFSTTSCDHQGIYRENSLTFAESSYEMDLLKLEIYRVGH